MKFIIDDYERVTNYPFTITKEECIITKNKGEWEENETIETYTILEIDTLEELMLFVGEYQYVIHPHGQSDWYDNCMACNNKGYHYLEIYDGYRE